MFDALNSLVERLQRAVGKLMRRVSNFGLAIVSPFERAIMAIAQVFFSLSERFEGIESLFGSLGRMLLWPFRALWRLLAAIINAVVPRSARNVLTAPFRGLAFVLQRIGQGMMRAAEMLNLDGLILRLVRWTRPIWYPFAAVGTFFVVWAATRPYKKLLWGVPILLLVTPILVATAWGAYWGKESIAARYRLALTESLEKKDYQRADLLERKLVDLGINTRLTDFKTAQAIGRDGKLAEAYERMQRMAPVDTPGYPLAHLWIIQHLLSHKLDVPADESHRLAGVHLKQLAALSIRGPEIDMMRAAWLTQENKLEEASDLLKPHIHLYSSAAVERFNIDMVLKRPDQARQDAAEVIEHMQRLKHDGSTLSSHEYESWAGAEQLLGNATAFREILREYLKHYPESGVARRSVAAVNLIEFDEMLSSPSSKPEELADRIRTAFSLTELTENMKERMTLLYQQKDIYPELRELFEILTKSRDLPPSLAETLGTAAAVNGAWDTAQHFLEQAVSKDPKNSVAWNNLSCALLQQKNAPLDRALVAANKAVELEPKDFRFRETRGEIYVKLGRWQEGVSDLEYALNGLPDAPVIHQSLSKAYEALGNKELAAIHRQNAN